MLVAKVIQGAANNVLFKKEAFMIPLNQFVKRMSERIVEFGDAVSAGVEAPEALRATAVERYNAQPDELDGHRKSLHRLCAQQMDKISAELSLVHIGGSGTGTSGVRSVRDALVEALRDLGPPPTLSQAATGQLTSSALTTCTCCARRVSAR